MVETSTSAQSRAFSRWLRTGRRPPIRRADGIEFKFNPWHDPADGRFTFSGSGHHYGAGGAGPGDRAPKAGASRTEQPAGYRKRPGGRGAIPAGPRAIAKAPIGKPPNPAAEFVGGVGEGVYGVAEGAVTGVYSAVTMNPVATVRKVGLEIAGAIDTAIAAEDRPAIAQIARVADAVANASAREIGRATGSVVGNAALMVAPGTALTEVSALRRLRMATPRPTYDPPEIGWVKETLKSDKAWKAYNDAATGAQAGQAPTLMRTMPDGSKRPVKFDGIEGEYVIDRKWSVTGKPRAVAQMLRQSEVLTQHRLVGTWEVPTHAQRKSAVKLFKRYNINNIKVRVVEP